MKRKLVALLSCSILMSSLVVACGTKNKEEVPKETTPVSDKQDKTVISFWHGYTPEKEKLLGEMIKKYESEHPEIKIESKFTASGEEMLQKVQTSLLADEVPDILWGFPTWTGILASTEKLKDLNEFMDESTKKDVFQGLQEAGTLDGKLYSVPIEAGALVLIYNKDMFKEVGLENAPTTWDELYNYSEKLTNDNYKGIWLPTKPDERTTWTWETFLWQNGGQLLSDDGKSVVFGNEKGKEALEMYTKFIKDGLSPKDIANDPFIEKKVAMVIATQGAANSYINKYNMNIGVANLPMKEKIATGLGSNHLYLFKSDEKQEKAAWEFCKWMISGENNAEWVSKTGYLPVSQSAVESKLYQDYGKENPHMIAAANTLQYGVTRPVIEQYPKISTAISTAIEFIVYDKKTVEEALQDAVKEAQDAIK